VSVEVHELTLLSKSLRIHREVARPGRRRDALSPALPGPDDQSGNPAGLSYPYARDHGDARYLDSQGFVESKRRCCSRSPAAARRARSPPSRTRSTPDVPAHCARVYLKRLIVGGLEGCTRSAELPQRGRLVQAQPEFTMLELYQAYADYET